MRRSVGRSLAAVLVCAVGLASRVFAQWEPDVRMTVAPGGASMEGRALATSGPVIHLVWQDDRSGTPQVYYRRSIDDGANWGAEAALSGDDAAYLPSISADGQTVHVAWLSGSPYAPTNEIQYRRSTDGGASWGDVQVLSSQYGSKSPPSVASSGGRVHVVWGQQTGLQSPVAYVWSDDGASWSPIQTVSGSSSSVTGGVSVTASGQNVDVAWSGNLALSDPANVYAMHSGDRGASWGAPVNLSNITSSQSTMEPAIASSGNALFVTWEAIGPGGATAVLRRFVNQSWQPVEPLAGAVAMSWHPTIAATGSDVHAVWIDDRDGPMQLHYKRSPNLGATWDPEVALTDESSTLRWYSWVAVSGSGVHVAWLDRRDGDQEVYYKRNPTGDAVAATAGDLDIYNDRADMHANVMRFSALAGASGPPLLSRTFALVNSDPSNNPDPDGPSQQGTLLDVSALGSPVASVFTRVCGRLPVAQVNGAWNAALVSLMDQRSQRRIVAAVVTPSTLTRGSVQRAVVYLCVPRSTRRGVYEGKVRVRGRWQPDGSTSDDFTIRAYVASFFPW